MTMEEVFLFVGSKTNIIRSIQVRLQTTESILNEYRECVQCRQTFNKIVCNVCMCLCVLWKINVTIRCFIFHTFTNFVYCFFFFLLLSHHWTYSIQWCTLNPEKYSTTKIIPAAIKICYVHTDEKTFANCNGFIERRARARLHTSTRSHKTDCARNVSYPLHFRCTRFAFVATFLLCCCMPPPSLLTPPQQYAISI